MRTQTRAQGAYTMKTGSAGAVTRRMVRTRAAELAVLHGRPLHQPSSEDLAQAAAEMTGDAEGDPNETEVDSALESIGGYAYGDTECQSDCERFVVGGVLEAHNHQMLEAARSDWDESTG